MLASRVMHYYEVVSSDVAATKALYEVTGGLTFDAPDEALGGAVVAKLPSGGRLGIRASMSTDEAPITRAYLTVDDVERASNAAAEAGATVALPPTALPGDHGSIAICIIGGVQHGFWQVP